MLSKKCINCGEIHLMAKKHFHKDRSRKDGLKPYCKKCANEQYRFYGDLKKKPLLEKECDYSKCNNKFTTRMESKRFCCSSCNCKAYQERKGLEDVRFRQNFLKKLSRKKEVRTISRKAWKFEEIEILMDNRKEGLQFKEIAKMLGRSSVACMTKHSDILKKRNIKKDKI